MAADLPDLRKIVQSGFRESWMAVFCTNLDSKTFLILRQESIHTVCSFWVYLGATAWNMVPHCSGAVAQLCV